MPTNQEKVSQLLADSHCAFINSQNNESLHLANEAIRLAPKNPDAYQCAGDAYMSLGQYEKAVESYKKAVKLDQNNGNRYFNLGYALATNEKAADAESEESEDSGWVLSKVADSFTAFLGMLRPAED